MKQYKIRLSLKEDLKTTASSSFPPTTLTLFYDADRHRCQNLWKSFRKIEDKSYEDDRSRADDDDNDDDDDDGDCDDGGNPI
jgi:hypothetical protein